MARTKKDLSNDPNITHQQALVEALLKKPRETKRIVIPGGANMHQWIDKDNLATTLWTWLRGCRYYDRVELSFAADPTVYSTRVEKKFDFDGNSPHPAWLMQNEGKLALARQFATIIEDTKNLVSIYAEKDGIYARVDEDAKFGPKNDDFQPVIEFVPYKSRYQT